MTRLAYPMQSVLITVRGPSEVMGKREEKDDLFVAEWHMPLSATPGMYAIVVKDKHYQSVIRASKCFVVNYMSYAINDKLVRCREMHGQHRDKFVELGLEKMEANNVDCPALSAAVGYAECEVEQEIQTGDNILFVARVLASFNIRNAERPFFTGEIYTTTR